MALVAKDRTFENMEITLDGAHLTGCLVKKCKVYYNGGKIPILSKTSFQDSNFLFGDAAERTLRFISHMYRSGNQQTIDALFELLRNDKLN